MPFIYSYTCNGLAPKYDRSWHVELLNAVVSLAWAQRDAWLRMGWSPVVELPQAVLGQGYFAGVN